NKGSLKAKDERMCEMMPIFFNEILKDNYYGKIKALYIDFDGVIIDLDVRKAIYKTLKKFNIDNFEYPKSFFNPNEYFKEYGLDKDSIKVYDDELDKTVSLNKSLLNQLKEIDIPKYIVTKSNKKRVIDYLKKYNIEKEFESIFSITKNKKNIEKIQTKLNFKEEDILYIGDSFQNDIKPFYNLGMRCVSFYAYSVNFIDNNWLKHLIQFYNEK
ncbi:MAG: HAD family hydrolase, partial [archaeon]